MLNKFSVLMMLLLGAGSLIGISTVYQPTNVGTQPQQQPQQQLVPPGQIQKQPPIVTQQQPQSTTGKIITQQRAETLAQATEDKQLLDRLFPQIIKRIDGNTLLQKIDAKTLAAKVLPYLDLKVSITERPGQRDTIKIPPLDTVGKIGASAAGCPSDEIIVSSGFTHNNDYGVGGIVTSMTTPRPENWGFPGGGWLISTRYTDDNQLDFFANCLKVELALKDVPPGGLSLQPPNNMR